MLSIFFIAIKYLLHIFELFDKLVRPLLCCGVKLREFSKPVHQERVHIQFCQKFLGVKKSTANDFVDGEFGRVSIRRSSFYSMLLV